MLDFKLLGDLAGRGHKLFNLAWRVHRSLMEEEQRRFYGNYEETGWLHHGPIVKEFCLAALAFQEELGNPTEGFENVTEHLLAATKLARELPAKIQERSPQEYLQFAPEFRTVFESGSRAIDAVRDKYRLDDPFAYVDRLEIVAVEPDPAIKLPASDTTISEIEKQDQHLANERTSPKQMSRIEVIDRLLLKKRSGEPYTSMGKLAKDIGCSSSTIQAAMQDKLELSFWRSSKTTKPKVHQLSNIDCDTISQDCEVSPSSQFSDEEQDAALQELVDQATAAERAKILGKTIAEKQTLANLILEQSQDDESEHVYDRS
ncbi:hypothetical protein [Lignipirellula cremea]|uniref:Uncharacterized protein n=1 Tax=Lignipirellula cremea TaxID=2528010 RepID=A0A518DRR7_9BACT|nr:hypothetical protein [Lignipirellula cremea]QDU94521.1 hypothetical protein Pla8534_23120 [Lignipirellula cremea]